MMYVETFVRYTDRLFLNWNFTNILKQDTVTYCTEFFRCIFIYLYISGDLFFEQT